MCALVFAYKDEPLRVNAHDELWRLIDDRHSLARRWAAFKKQHCFSLAFRCISDFVVRPVPFEARAVVEDRRRSVATRHDGRDVSPRMEILHRKGIAQQVVEQGPRGGVLVVVVRR